MSTHKIYNHCPIKNLPSYYYYYY